MRKQIDDGTDIDIEYLKSQFVDMYDKLKEFTECSVCFEQMTGENMEVPYCGHAICKTCLARIKAEEAKVCPLCKKKY